MALVLALALAVALVLVAVVVLALALVLALAMAQALGSWTETFETQILVLSVYKCKNPRNLRFGFHKVALDFTRLLMQESTKSKVLISQGCFGFHTVA